MEIEGTVSADSQLAPAADAVLATPLFGRWRQVQVSDLMAHYYWSALTGYTSQKAEADFRYKAASGEEIRVGGSYLRNTRLEIVGARAMMIFDDFAYVGGALAKASLLDNSASPQYVGKVTVGMRVNPQLQLYLNANYLSDGTLDGFPDLLTNPLERLPGFTAGFDLNFQGFGQQQVVFGAGVNW